MANAVTKQEQGEKIPENWINCTKFSEELIGDLFIVSKTPLCDNFESCLWDDDIYKPKMLFDYAEETFHRQIGLFIDLTSSNKFIQKKDIDQFNCEFRKIICQKSIGPPNKANVLEFKNIVNNHIKKDPDSIIAVSCINGLDVSGFFIVSYYITEHEYSIDKALNMFERARPPGIMNETYRKEIRVRYINGHHLSYPYKQMRDKKSNFKKNMKKENHRRNNYNNNNNNNNNFKIDSKEQLKQELLNADYALTADDVNKFLEVVRRKTRYHPHYISCEYQRTLELMVLLDKRVDSHVQIYCNRSLKDVPHYVTIYYNGSYVFIYDSLCEITSTHDINMDFNDYLKKMFPDLDQSKYCFPKVTNVDLKPMDSGVFCCAFITSICLGKNPEYEYYFSESMRPNLCKIIGNRQLYSFESNYKTPLVASTPVNTNYESQQQMPYVMPYQTNYMPSAPNDFKVKPMPFICHLPMSPLSAPANLTYETQQQLPYGMQYSGVNMQSTSNSYKSNTSYHPASTSNVYAQDQTQFPLNGVMNIRSNSNDRNYDSDMSFGRMPNGSNHSNNSLISPMDFRSNLPSTSRNNAQMSPQNFDNISNDSYRPNNSSNGHILSTSNVNSHNQMFSTEKNASTASNGGKQNSPSVNDQSRVPSVSPSVDNLPSISPFSFVSELRSTPNLVNPVMSPVREETAMEQSNDEDEDDDYDMPPPIVRIKQETFKVKVETEMESTEQQVSIEDDDEYSDLPMPYTVKIKQEHMAIKSEPLSGTIQVIKTSNPPEVDSQDLDLILSKLNQHISVTSSADRVRNKIFGWMKNQNHTEFPSTLPNLVTRLDLKEMFEKKNYLVSWKPDGIRFLLYVENKDNVFLINRQNEVYRARSIFLPKSGNPKCMLEETLLDGEMVIDIGSNGDLRLRFLIFDIIRYENEDLTGCSLGKRMECITIGVLRPYDKLGKVKKLNPSSIFFYYTYFLPLDNTFEKITKTKKPHKTDGLIFHHKDRMGQAFKWMPVQKCTVDVLCNSFTLFLRKDKKEDSKVVQCGIINQSEATQNINNEIIECYWDFGSRWIFLRKRPDKKYPNTVEEFERIKEFISHPITEIDLEKYIQDHFNVS